MEDIYFKKIITIVILVALLVLSFFLLKPILLSIIFGIILAFVFSPIYNWFYNKTKSKNLSALIICIFLLLIIIPPIWFLTPRVIDESIKLYMASQQMDFVTPLKKIFPSLFVSNEFAEEIGPVIHSFITKFTNSLMNEFSQIILNFPKIALQIAIVFFTLFFVIRDKDKLISYVQSLLPFSPEVEKKLFKSSKDITILVIYGQIFIGAIQGLIIGAGFFIFGVPNALLLTLFAALAGILPIIGPAIVYVPVIIYLLIANNISSAIGIIIFGLISTFSDIFLRPIFVSKRTKLNPGVVLIGMIGGFFLFGVLGFILGPLILSYIIIILDIYRKKNF